MINKINNQGQTLIEVIVSLFIITVGIIGTLMLANYSIQAGTQSRERVQASVLAQEGIEVVKNIRDTNWIKMANGVTGVTWNSNLSVGPVDDAAYSSSFPINTIGKLNGLTGANGALTNFDRTTIIDEVSSPANPDKKQVTCIVSWTNSRGLQTVKAIDYITNWQPINP